MPAETRYRCRTCGGDVIVGPHPLEPRPLARHVSGAVLLPAVDATHAAVPADRLHRYEVTEHIVYEVWATDEDDACEIITEDGERNQRCLRVPERFATPVP